MNLESLYNSELGVNVNQLWDHVKRYENSLFVELGSSPGTSATVMLIDSQVKNNNVVAIDTELRWLPAHLMQNRRYEPIKGDSSSVGKIWDRVQIAGLFVDTIHAKEQVLCEIKFWYPHVKEGGFIAFHDTHWADDHFDVYNGVQYEKPEKAVIEYFGIDESLNHEDEFIKVSSYPESFGMTFVEIKKKKDYESNVKDWDAVFKVRDELTKFCWADKPDETKDMIIDFEIGS